MAASAMCTFGTRTPIDVNEFNEKIYREIKGFRNYKIYRPNYKSYPVAGKFYAAHDQVKESPQLKAKIDKYQRNIALTRMLGPKDKYTEPVTENMVYGWVTKKLMHIDPNDRRFNHVKKDSPHTKVQTMIAQADRIARARSRQKI